MPPLTKPQFLVGGNGQSRSAVDPQHCTSKFEAILDSRRRSLQGASSEHSGDTEKEKQDQTFGAILETPTTFRPTESAPLFEEIFHELMDKEDDDEDKTLMTDAARAKLARAATARLRKASAIRKLTMSEYERLQSLLMLGPHEVQAAAAIIDVPPFERPIKQEDWVQWTSCGDSDEPSNKKKWKRLKRDRNTQLENRPSPTLSNNRTYCLPSPPALNPNLINHAALPSSNDEAAARPDPVLSSEGLVRPDPALSGEEQGEESIWASFFSIFCQDT